ncbi:MAG: ImmA/IrrE family metallo-endopeptidase [Clostridiales bacterium]|nr:ImmA/IrrE family metallo-endopeptidase [Clostridiales bacterium]
MTIDSSGIFDSAERIVYDCVCRDPFIAARDTGVYIDYIDEFKDLLGMITVVNGEKHILLNNSMCDVTKRIVCAHELGHGVLHRSQLSECGGFRDVGSCYITDILEYEANAFAAHLLIDNNDIMERIRDYSNVSGLAQGMNTELDLMLIKLNEMKRLGYDVNVPMETNARFLSDLGPDSCGRSDGFSDGV